MIIGLVGLKESGKDTVGAYLVKKHNFERRAFADKLKQSIAALLDISFSEVDKLKADDSAYLAVGYHNEPEQKFEGQPSKMWSPIYEQSFRSALQRYGTEAHRDIFGNDFWLDSCLPVGGFYAGRAIVVTDCRFQNEADRVRLIGGYIVSVQREGPLVKDPHRSEVEQESVKPDYVLDNDGTIDELYDGIEEMLVELGVRMADSR